MLTFFTDFAYRKLKTSLYFSFILTLKPVFMKQALTHLKLSLLALAFVSLVSSCNQDDFHELPHNTKLTPKQSSIVKTISFHQFLEKSDFKKQHQLEHIKKSTVERNDSVVYSISLETIKQITKDHSISFTFAINGKVDSNSIFENFMIKQDGDGHLYYFIISYKSDSLNTDNLYQSQIKQIQKEQVTYQPNAVLLTVMPIESGGGSGMSDCNGEIDYEIDSCNQNGYHALKYCCQHASGSGGHGCGDIAPCNYVCTGTNIRSVVIDFSGCDDLFDSTIGHNPRNPTPTIPQDPTQPPAGGGSNQDDRDTSPTLTSPVDISVENPEECPNLEGDLDGNCSIDDFEACLLNQNPEQYCECITDENTTGCIIVEDFEEDSKTKCVHESLKSNGNNFTLYDRLLTNFNDYFDDHLILETGNTGTDWGYTTGQAGVDNAIIDNPNFYNVTISETLDQNGSNLAITVTLIHEIMHAYMYQSLFDAGLIDFDENGDPVPVGNLCNLTLSLNNYTIGELFSAYICELNQNNELDEQWSHDLFNTNVFSISTFQEQIADYIYQNHDWDSEPQFLITSFDSAFGSDWKTMISQIISWRGLEKTDDFENWAIQNNIEFFFDSEGNIAGEYGGYITTIKDFGNKNCNL